MNLDKADNIMADAIEKLLNNGIPHDQIPHVFVSSALHLLTLPPCQHVTLQEFQRIRTIVDQRIKTMTHGTTH